jgi:hypothetical protein
MAGMKDRAIQLSDILRESAKKGAKTRREETKEAWLMAAPIPPFPFRLPFATSLFSRFRAESSEN